MYILRNTFLSTLSHIVIMATYRLMTIVIFLWFYLAAVIRLVFFLAVEHVDFPPVPVLLFPTQDHSWQNLYV